MSIDKTGGPAFPTSPNKDDPAWAAARDGGMTLRDYFAAKAMDLVLWNSDPRTQAYSANLCYTMADAMIAARSKQ